MYAKVSFLIFKNCYISHIEKHSERPLRSLTDWQMTLLNEGAFKNPIRNDFFFKLLLLSYSACCYCYLLKHFHNKFTNTHLLTLLLFVYTQPIKFTQNKKWNLFYTFIMHDSRTSSFSHQCSLHSFIFRPVRNDLGEHSRTPPQTCSFLVYLF